jgi:phosphoribosylanthranilate isomerase
MIHIKICGITNLEDAQNVISLGFDALGFIFAKDSPRYITPEAAEEICLFLPPFIKLVGVFVDEDPAIIEEIVKRCKLDLIQLHGSESPKDCLNLSRKVIKAFRVQDLEDIKPIIKYQGIVSAILLDTKLPSKMGGTGQVFDWGLAIQAKEFDIPLILAGGINHTNIKKAIQLVNPYAVDISSGVEISAGKKDYNKMKELKNLVQNL